MKKRKNRLDNAEAGLQFTSFLHNQQWVCSTAYQLHWLQAALIP